MDMSTLSWPAIVVAAISAFFLGGIWYSPILFNKPWMKENNFTPEIVRSGNKAKIFGWSFILSLVMAFNLAMFLNAPDIDFHKGLIYGLLAGVWIFCGIAIIALFELRSLRYILINGGYCLIALGLMGAILGAWR
jgi:hypothetical protein